MECDICTEQFDGAERLPKSMPCGHTACLQCLRRLPDCSCPTCRRDFNGPPEGLPHNFTVLKFLEGRRLDSTPIVWCSDCRTAATSLCMDHVHNVMPTRTALRRHLQDALPLAAEQLLTFQDQCLDDQVLSALLLLMVESWEVSLRGGGHELTGTLRNNTEDPCMKVLWLLLAALTEDQAATRRDPPPAAAPSPSAAAPTQGPQSAAAPAPSAAASTPSATAPAPSAAALTPIQGPPRAEVHPTREMDVGDISWRRPEDMKPEKAAALEEALGVTRLVDVRCHRDPAWSLELLQRAAPSLEQLSVHNPSEDHLRAVHAMPRLKRLYVTASPNACIPELPELPPGHAGLQWLRVWGLRRQTLSSMLKAHGESLEEVQLSVGTPMASSSYSYPYDEYKLDSLLQWSALRAMRKLVLKRHFVHHNADSCVRQRASIRLHLDGVEVLCDQCDGVVAEEL